MADEDGGAKIALPMVDFDHNPEAPTMFVDGASGMVVSDEIVRLNFFQDNLLSADDNHESLRAQRRICARIVLTPATFVKVAKWWAEAAAEVEARLVAKATVGVDERSKAD